MSSPNEPISPLEGVGSAAGAGGSNPAQFNAGGEVSASTTVKNMEDLKQKAPEVYNAMLQGIAMSMINQSKRAADRLKEIIRQGTRDAQRR